MRRFHSYCGLAAALTAAVLSSPLSVRAENGPPAPSLSAAPGNVVTAADSPRIAFGGAPLPVLSPQTAPFRDTGGDLYAAPEMLAPLGITFVVDDKTGQVTLCGPDGGATISVPARRIDGKPGVFVPAVQVIEALGGKCEWSAATNTLYARAILVSAEILGGQLRLKATLPITPVVRIDKGSRQIVIDVPGAEVGSLAKTLNISDPNVIRSRAGQFEDDIARIVLITKEPAAFALLSPKPAVQAVLNPADPDKVPALSLAGAVAKATTAVAAAAPPVKPVKSVASGSKGGPSHVSDITFRKISDTRAQFIVSADRAPSVRAGLSKGCLTLDLLNTTFTDRDALAGVLDACQHPFLKAASIATGTNTAARLILSLTRAVGYSIRPLDGGRLLVDLNSITGVDGGPLTGKTVVVDPGHGAHDSGARGGGFSEKNVNLAIGLKLAQELRDAGANVIMTRSDDTFIEVDDRPTPGNRAAADFFISVHADSGDRNHSVNGSTVYFHMDWASCKSLAQSIAGHLASDVGTIRSRGVHSDAMKFGGRFVNGYGVLRLSQMVAVLVECGYMSNSGDVSRMNDSATQKKIAGAIAAGLKDYVAANPNFDTRFINPQPTGASGGIVPAPGDDGAELVNPDGTPADPPPSAPQPAPAEPNSGTDPDRGQ